MTATELAAAIRAKKISAEATARAALDRIAARNFEVNAFTATTPGRRA